MSSSSKSNTSEQQIPTDFRALVARRVPGAERYNSLKHCEAPVSNETTLTVERLPFDALPDEPVTVRVRYSSLNYKDALAARGHAGVVKSLPHIPGVDAAGEVIESRDERFKVGDHVLVTGFELGAPRWGAFSELIRVPGDWVVPLSKDGTPTNDSANAKSQSQVGTPTKMTLRTAMIYGTAGLTAAQSVAALIHNGITPSSGEVVVTGASGGVGSVAVGILVKLGYEVVAVSGKSKDDLLARGVKRVITREEILDTSGKPLLKSAWAGAIDNVGGATLASIIRATRHRGCVTTCGNVGGVDLPLTVFPFILRGVTLQGIDTAACPMPLKIAMWKKLADEWMPRDLESLVQAEASLEDMPHWIEEILNGRTKGRVVVKTE